MFVIGGIGKEVSPEAYLGVVLCKGCRQPAHQYLIESSRKASLYFVPIAKSSDWYQVCASCNSSFEVYGRQRRQLLDGSANLPAPEVYAAIWADLECALEALKRQVNESGVDRTMNLSDLLNSLAECLVGRYPRREIQAVIEWSFTEYIVQTVENA